MQCLVRILVFASPTWGDDPGNMGGSQDQAAWNAGMAREERERREAEVFLFPFYCLTTVGSRRDMLFPLNL